MGLTSRSAGRAGRGGVERGTNGSRGERGTSGGSVLFKLIVFLAAVFAVTALAWMLLLPLVITSQLRARTGFDATIKRLAVNPIAGTVSLEGFVLANPPTFPLKDFLELRAFRANAKLTSLFTQHVVFDSMFVDVETVTLVKRKDGSTNAEAFKKNFETPQDGKARPPSSGPPRTFLVRELRLKLDRLVIVDHSGREPRVQTFSLGINQSYVDVTDPAQLMAPKVLQSLAPIALAASGLLPGDIGKTLGDAARSGTNLIKETGRATASTAKRLFDALEESKKP